MVLLRLWGRPPGTTRKEPFKGAVIILPIPIEINLYGAFPDSRHPFPGRGNSGVESGLMPWK